MTADVTTSEPVELVPSALRKGDKVISTNRESSIPLFVSGTVLEVGKYSIYVDFGEYGQHNLFREQYEITDA